MFFHFLIRCAFAAALLAIALPAHAAPPPARLEVLARGINLTHWLRFPPGHGEQALARYLSDADLEALHRAGFTFLRLAVQPAVVRGRPGLLIATIRRIQSHGLGVMVGWHLPPGALADTRQQQALLDLWDRTAPALRPLDARLTFPEVVNEPDIPDAAWSDLQPRILARIRQALPDATVVLTGSRWGSLAGLRAHDPLPDGNVVYSFHSYEPPVLTTLGSFEAGLDHRALARLPFPVNAPGCAAAEAATPQQRTRDVMRWYCGEHWDSEKVAAGIRAAGAWSRRNNVPLVAGEFGASKDLPPATRLAWIAAMRTALEHEGIGWALWGYDDSMGFDLRPGGRLDPGLLQALGLHAPR